MDPAILISNKTLVVNLYRGTCNLRRINTCLPPGGRIQSRASAFSAMNEWQWVSSMNPVFESGCAGVT
jgi:hypothetical protein